MSYREVLDMIKIKGSEIKIGTVVDLWFNHRAVAISMMKIHRPKVLSTLQSK
jgi:hypothetical protein